jgi:hypothetical protein
VQHALSFVKSLALLAEEIDRPVEGVAAKKMLDALALFAHDVKD